MNERFRPNKFERLDQDSRTRFKQVENFRLAQVNNVTSEVEPKIRKTRTAISAAASLSLILLAACATIKANESQNVGDVDCNGRTNSIDAALILQKTAGLIDTLTCKLAADVNGDSQSNAIDASLILQFDARLINNLPVQSIKKDLPTIEILDETFRGSELLATGLIRPEAIVVNPVDDSVYYVAKKRIGKNHESIYQLNGKDVIYRFPGAGDPWGNIQQTEVAINQNGELFAYSHTYIDEYIRVYDTKTGEVIIEIENPFPIENRMYAPIKSVAANPMDNKFYMSTSIRTPSETQRYLLSFDPETGTLELDTSENIHPRYNMCFDSSGTAYLGDGYYENLEVIPPDEDSQIIEFENLRNIVESIVGDYEEFNIEGLACDNSGSRVLIYGYAIPENYIEKGGTDYLPKI